MDYLPLILKNLFRNKRRTILTTVSIAISLFIFSALVSLPTFANQVLADTASSVRLACRTKMGLAYPLPEGYRNKIATTPHVVAIVPDNFFGGIYHEVSDEFPSIAMDPGQIAQMFPDWGISAESFDRFRKVRTGCLVAQNTMHRFNLRVGQQIQLRGTRYRFNVALTIVGTIAKGPAPSFLIFRRDYLEEIQGRPGNVDNFWVRVDRSESVPSVIAALNQQFANSSAETQCQSESVFLGSMIGRFRIFFKLAQMLGFVVVATIGLVAINTAAMSIRERRGEIAVMRSIGFPARVILMLLIGESMMIALGGALIGCGAALAVLKVFAVNADAIGPFATLQMSPAVVLEALVLAMLIGLISAYVPANAAVRRRIVDVLRVAD
jgi:putative ABC transport system permease protein